MSDLPKPDTDEEKQEEKLNPKPKLSLKLDSSPPSLSPEATDKTKTPQKDDSEAGSAASRITLPKIQPQAAEKQAVIPAKLPEPKVKLPLKPPPSETVSPTGHTSFIKPAPPPPNLSTLPGQQEKSIERSTPTGSGQSLSQSPLVKAMRAASGTLPTPSPTPTQPPAKGLTGLAALAKKETSLPGKAHTHSQTVSPAPLSPDAPLPVNTAEATSTPNTNASASIQQVAPGVTSTPFLTPSEPPAIRQPKIKSNQAEGDRLPEEVHPAKKKKAWNPEEEMAKRQRLRLDKTKAPWADGGPPNAGANDDPFGHVSLRTETRGPFVDSEGSLVDVPATDDNDLGQRTPPQVPIDGTPEINPQAGLIKSAGIAGTAKNKSPQQGSGLVSAATRAPIATNKQQTAKKAAAQQTQVPLIKGTRPPVAPDNKPAAAATGGLVGAALSRAPFKGSVPEPTAPGQGPMKRITARPQKRLPNTPPPIKATSSNAAKSSPTIAGTAKKRPVGAAAAMRQVRQQQGRSTQQQQQKGGEYAASPLAPSGAGKAIIAIIFVIIVIAGGLFTIFREKDIKTEVNSIVNAPIPKRTDGVLWQESEVKVSSLPPPDTASQALAADITQATVIPATEEPVKPSVPTNPAVERFLKTLDIKAVRVAGANSKLVTNRGTYEIGANIYPEFGVTFIDVNAEKQELQFKDDRGRIYTRSY